MDTEKRTDPDFEQKNKAWLYDDFRSYLLDSATHLPVSEKQLPPTISLAPSGFELMLRELHNETFSDAKRLERSRHFKTNYDNSALLISRKSVIGTETSVTTTSKLMSVRNALDEEKYARSEVLLGSAHSHGIIDIPPSPRDFSIVLSEKNDGMLFFVVTHSTQFMIMRTLQTTLYSETDFEHWQKKESNVLQSALPQKNTKRTPQDEHLLSTMQFVLRACDEHALGLYTSHDYTLFTRVVA